MNQNHKVKESDFEMEQIVLGGWYSSFYIKSLIMQVVPMNKNIQFKITGKDRLDGQEYESYHNTLQSAIKEYNKLWAKDQNQKDY